MPYDELTKKHLENLKQDIQTVLAAKNLNDTGQVSQSLEVNGTKLLADDYIYYLDQGRAPGKFPPIRNLREWVMNKLGVSFDESKSIAYLIGRKIAREGTDIFRDHSKGLQLRDLIDNMLDELTQELPEVMAAQALETIYG